MTPNYKRPVVLEGVDVRKHYKQYDSFFRDIKTCASIEESLQSFDEAEADIKSIKKWKSA